MHFLSNLIAHEVSRSKIYAFINIICSSLCRDNFGGEVNWAHENEEAKAFAAQSSLSRVRLSLVVSFDFQPMLHLLSPCQACRGVGALKHSGYTSSSSSLCYPRLDDAQFRTAGLFITSENRSFVGVSTLNRLGGTVVT